MTSTAGGQGPDDRVELTRTGLLVASAPRSALIPASTEEDYLAQLKRLVVRDARNSFWRRAVDDSPPESLAELEHGVDLHANLLRAARVAAANPGWTRLSALVPQLQASSRLWKPCRAEPAAEACEADAWSALHAARKKALEQLPFKAVVAPGRAWLRSDSVEGMPFGTPVDVRVIEGGEAEVSPARLLEHWRLEPNAREAVPVNPVAWRRVPLVELDGADPFALVMEAKRQVARGEVEPGLALFDRAVVSGQLDRAGDGDGRHVTEFAVVHGRYQQWFPLLRLADRAQEFQPVPPAPAPVALPTLQPHLTLLFGCRGALDLATTADPGLVSPVRPNTQRLSVLPPNMCLKDVWLDPPAMGAPVSAKDLKEFRKNVGATVTTPPLLRVIFPPTNDHSAYFLYSVHLAMESTTVSETMYHARRSGPFRLQRLPLAHAQASESFTLWVTLPRDGYASTEVGVVGAKDEAAARQWTSKLSREPQVVSHSGPRVIPGLELPRTPYVDAWQALGPFEGW